MYESKNIQFVPFFGWFPVKLKTYVGEPIEYKPERTVDELVNLVGNFFISMIKILLRIRNKDKKHNTLSPYKHRCTPMCIGETLVCINAWRDWVFIKIKIFRCK